MSESRDRKERDHGAIVRKRIHSARSHRGHSMQKFGADSGLLSPGEIVFSKRLKSDAHPA